MQEGRKWDFGWNVVVYTYWKYRQNDTFWTLVQVSSQIIHTFMEKQDVRKQ